MNNTCFKRVTAPDNIHDEIVVNEYAPRHGWLEYYRRKDGLRDIVISAAIGMGYCAIMTLAYLWG